MDGRLKGREEETREMLRTMMEFWLEVNPYSSFTDLDRPFTDEVLQAWLAYVHGVCDAEGAHLFNSLFCNWGMGEHQKAVESIFTLFVEWGTTEGLNQTWFQAMKKVKNAKPFISGTLGIITDVAFGNRTVGQAVAYNVPASLSGLAAYTLVKGVAVALKLTNPVGWAILASIGIAYGVKALYDHTPFGDAIRFIGCQIDASIQRDIERARFLRESAGNGINWAGDRISDGVNWAGDRVVDEINRIGDSIDNARQNVREIGQAINNVGHTIRDIRDFIDNPINWGWGR